MNQLIVGLEGAVCVLSDGTDGAPRRVHLFDEMELRAVEAALLAERPLLLRGEPGVGKSQLAEAIARQMGWKFVKETVDAKTDPDDLKWYEDAVERLSRAQFAGAGAFTEYSKLEMELARSNFIYPGVLWKAFDWAEAHPDEDLPERVVVLIDEIDKADSAVPNALLEALGSGSFQPPGHKMVTAKRWPLIILTTNEDRPLPPAFLRRCLVHNMDPKEEELQSWLFRRGVALFPDAPRAILTEAAEAVLEDRADAASRRNVHRPGLAEYLDLLRALLRTGETDPSMLSERMGKIREFFLVKS